MKPLLHGFRAQRLCLSNEYHAVLRRSSPTHTVRGLASAAAAPAPAPAQPSTVHRGLAFEERSMDILRHDMSMTLKRIGGKDDGGIDFFGWWWLPHESPTGSEPRPSSSSSSSSVLHQRRRIRVIGQCKAEKKKIGPNYVRELEGVLYRFLTLKSDQPYLLPGGVVDVDVDGDGDGDMKSSGDILSFDENPSPAVALLVSQSAFTKSTVLRANSSAIPFCLLHLPPAEPHSIATAAENVIEQSNNELSGNLGSVWCNPALCGAKGLLKGRMEVRWERHSEKMVSARPALWWDGIRLSSWVPELAFGNQSGNHGGA